MSDLRYSSVFWNLESNSLSIKHTGGRSGPMAAAVFPSSEVASYIIGATLRVDDGILIT
jgi:hypothetical protein